MPKAPGPRPATASVARSLAAAAPAADLFPDGYPWPLTAAAKLQNAGLFDLADRDFRVTYRGPTLAVHVYEYPAQMRFNGVQVELEPGDVTISRPGGETSYHLPQPGRHWCVHVHPPPEAGHADAAPCAILPRHLRPGARHLDVISAIRRAAADLDFARRHPAAAATARAAAAAGIQECLLQLALTEATGATPAPGEANGKAAAAVARAAVILDERCDDPPPMPWIAEQVGLDQNYLARQFRTIHGVTMQAYARHRRMERARHWLAVSDLPIAEVARRVGMDDLQRFNKAFRVVAGMSPRAWRTAQGGRRGDWASGGFPQET